MQIYVCVKHVPDSAVNITIVDHIRIDENITFLLNPYDEHAVTEAVSIKKTVPGSEVVAVCLGPDHAQKTLQSALAMGADRGILIHTSDQHDSIVTARALKTAIEQDGNPGMIFTGKESIDIEGMQTMFRLGALFDFPVASNIVKLDIVDSRAVVDCQMQAGAVHTYEMRLPCVLGAGRGLNSPGYPTFQDVVKSRKKTIEKKVFKDLGIKSSMSGMQTVLLEPLIQKRKPKQITGDAKKIAEKIRDILKYEAKVIS